MRPMQPFNIYHHAPFKQAQFDFNVKVDFQNGNVSLTAPQQFKRHTPTHFIYGQTVVKQSNEAVQTNYTKNTQASMIESIGAIDCVICGKVYTQENFQQHLQYHRNRQKNNFTISKNQSSPKQTNKESYANKNSNKSQECISNSDYSFQQKFINHSPTIQRVQISKTSSHYSYGAQPIQIIKNQPQRTLQYHHPVNKQIPIEVRSISSQGMRIYSKQVQPSSQNYISIQSQNGPNNFVYMNHFGKPVNQVYAHSSPNSQRFMRFSPQISRVSETSYHSLSIPFHQYQNNVHKQTNPNPNNQQFFRQAQNKQRVSKPAQSNSLKYSDASLSQNSQISIRRPEDKFQSPTSISGKGIKQQNQVSQQASIISSQPNKVNQSRSRFTKKMQDSSSDDQQFIQKPILQRAIASDFYPNRSLALGNSVTSNGSQCSRYSKTKIPINYLARQQFIESNSEKQM